MNSDNLTITEQELRALGDQEVQLENALQVLRIRCRQAGLSGQHHVAEQAWELFEKYRSELADLQTRIRKLEARFYSSQPRLRK